MIIYDNGLEMKNSSYSSEAELQKIIFDIPRLLSNDDNKSSLISLKREVRLKDSGIIDVLLLSTSGTVTVVEVKLSRNSQSRREVAAQILDYVSELSGYSYFDLDNVTDGALSEVVEGLNNSELPRIIENNLKNCQIRLVIAVDEANKDLRRIAQFISDHTDFNLDLIEINKIKDGDRNIYSTNTIIDTSSSTVSEQLKRSSHNIGLLDKIEAAWNNSYPEHSTATHARSWRQIFIDGWNRDLHYEFTLASGGGVAIRLDNENMRKHDYSEAVADKMNSYIDKEICGIKIRGRQSSGERRNSCVIFLSVDESNAELAPEIMNKLIQMSHSDISQIISRKN